MSTLTATSTLADLQAQVMTWLKGELDKKNGEGEATHRDFCKLMSHLVGDDVTAAQYSLDLDKLEADITKLLSKSSKPAKPDAGCLTSTPVPPAPVTPDEEDADRAQATLHRIRLKYLAVSERLCLKGASSLHAIVNSLKVCLTGTGNQTEKYPVDILFGLGGLLAGQPLAPLSVGLGNGVAVIMSCHLLSFCAIKFGWLTSGSPLPPVVQQSVGRRLLRCLRVSARYDPAPDLQTQIQKTFQAKVQASLRTRPTPLQFLFGSGTWITAACCKLLSCSAVLAAHVLHQKHFIH